MVSVRFVLAQLYHSLHCRHRVALLQCLLHHQEVQAEDEVLCDILALLCGVVCC